MTRRFLTRAVLVLAVLPIAVWATATSPAAAEITRQPLILAGCGSNVPITRLLVEAFTVTRPEIRMDVQPIGSTNAIWTAARGATSLGLISRPLTDEEQALGLTLVPYARTAVVIGVHPTVVEADITADDLIAIYRGTKRRWRDGGEIVLLTRERGDSSVQELRREVRGFGGAYLEGQAAAMRRTIYSEQEMHRLLAATPLAIGLSDLGTLAVERLAIKPLKVEGIAPTLDHLASGLYPLTKTLAFAFREDSARPEVHAFLDFVRSAEGAKILRENGYLPVQ
ncbi:MAG: substrate-binding domain-containing protein [Candidatus Rokuibacteriota bacterium]